jgi:hypothetical protein
MVKTPQKLLRGQRSLTDYFQPSPSPDKDKDKDKGSPGDHDENVNAANLNGRKLNDNSKKKPSNSREASPAKKRVKKDTQVPTKSSSTRIKEEDTEENDAGNEGPKYPGGTKVSKVIYTWVLCVPVVVGRDKTKVAAYESNTLIYYSYYTVFLMSLLGISRPWMVSGPSPFF